MEQKKIHYAPKLIGELLDIIHNAILVIDSHKRIIFVNSRTARMFNTTVPRLQGQLLTELFMPEDRDIMVSNILKIICLKGEYEGETMFRRADNSTFLGRIAGTFFRWDNDQDGIAFTIHDITAMKSIQRSLRRSERIAFLGRLLDDISHQIRNPVTVIGGLAKRLVAENSCPVKCQAILREASQLEDLMDTLAKFIKLAKPDPKRILLKSFVEVAEKSLRATVEELGCTWISDCDETIMDETLLVDPELLCSALQSVVVNACESYEPDAAEKPVTFKVRRTSDPKLPYAISIRDQGVGIPEEETEHVFSHFYSNKTKHIGMGLTFAQRIIEEHMGEITIDSHLGRGTVITFHLVKERRRLIRTTRLELQPGRDDGINDFLDSPTHADNPLPKTGAA